MLNRILSAAVIASVTIIALSYASGGWSWWYDMPFGNAFRSGFYWPAFLGRCIVVASFIIGMVVDPFVKTPKLPKIKVQVDQS